MKIPVFNLTRQYESIRSEIDYSIGAVLSQGTFTLGTEVSVFEREFAAYIGSGWAVGLGSGTDALTLGLRALDIGTGDEVIVPANAYPTAFGVALSGVRLKLVDCLPDGTLDPALVKSAVTKKTKAVIAVHLYGTPVDMDALREALAGVRNRVAIIEDAAQAHGTEIQESGWKMAGSVGDIGCFSFYPTKNIGAYGDGGMIVTDKKSVRDRLVRLRMYGEKERYNSVEISGISRLDELQAAVLRVKLRHLPAWIQRRRDIAALYTKELSGVNSISIVTGIHPAAGKPSHHVFVIRTMDREALQRFLAEKSVGTGIHYPVPIHMAPAFRGLGYSLGDFPQSEKLAGEVLSLPMYPELTNVEVETVAGYIREFYQTT